jgi:hypothetical protein
MPPPPGRVPTTQMYAPSHHQNLMVNGVRPKHQFLMFLDFKSSIIEVSEPVKIRFLGIAGAKFKI